jgi:hypothetical protein
MNTQSIDGTTTISRTAYDAYCERVLAVNCCECQLSMNTQSCSEPDSTETAALYTCPACGTLTLACCI